MIGPLDLAAAPGGTSGQRVASDLTEIVGARFGVEAIGPGAGVVDDSDGSTAVGQDLFAELDDGGSTE